MKHISKFNESKGITIYEGVKKLVYVVIVNDNQKTYGDESQAYVFINRMKAADKFIELVSEALFDSVEEFDEEFERYYEDGERLFADVEENPDFEKAKKAAETFNIDIKLIDANIE